MRAIQNLRKNKQSGFTLLEILLVVAAIAILAGIVIFAINPGKQLGDTRNAQRWVDVNTIIKAVYQYSFDNNGTIPATIQVTSTDICRTGASSCTGLIDLSVLTNNSKYLVAIPIDPQASPVTSTDYQISRDSDNRVTISAPNAENGEVILIKL